MTGDEEYNIIVLRNNFLFDVFISSNLEIIIIIIIIG